MIKRLEAKIRRDGIGGLMRTALEIIRDSIYLKMEAYYMVCDLTDAASKIEPRKQLETVAVDRDSLNILESRVDDSELRNVIRKRILGGHVGFLAFVDRKLAAYSFATTQKEYEPVVGVSIRPEAGEVYMYNGYTIREFRGAGYYSVLLADELEYFRRRGYKRATAIVLTTNIPSIRVVTKNKFEKKKYIKTIRLARIVVRESVTDIDVLGVPQGNAMSLPR